MSSRPELQVLKVWQKIEIFTKKIFQAFFNSNNCSNLACLGLATQPVHSQTKDSEESRQIISSDTTLSPDF